MNCHLFLDDEVGKSEIRNVSTIRDENITSLIRKQFRSGNFC